ncbi:MAG: TonB-dependent receptor plug domain-containing protein [Bacteroidales bacterium]|nr:TonB-dependent receptor plug domain-containing protein [Bacteroidales bacterium]
MLTTLFVSILCAFAPTAVISPATAAPDTTAIYLIDNEQIKASEFDGSQLVGQRIVTYRIDTVKTNSTVYDDLSVQYGEERVIIIHLIDTERGPKQPDTMGNHIVIVGQSEPLYIVDGVAVAADEVKKMDARTIESMSVLKSPKAVTQYGQAAKHGVVIIQTKKSSKKP